MASASGEEDHFTFHAVPGYFQQDDLATNDRAFDFTRSNFGLIERPYDTESNGVSDGADVPDSSSETPVTSWQRFVRHLQALNHHAEKNVSYRLMFMGRHGQGWHNVAEDFYGTAAWDCYYSTLDGNDTMTWDDAHLTELGISQAQTVHDFWLHQIKIEKMPLPESYYVSPMDRAIHTAAITFRDLPGLNTTNDTTNDTTNSTTIITTAAAAAAAATPSQPNTAKGIYPPFKVHELSREVIGIHTCDRRSSLSQIRSRFSSIHPPLSFPSNFPPNDPLWSPTLREDEDKTDARTRLFLDSIFSSDSRSMISVTSHSGVTASFLRVIGHRKFWLGTGAVIPVLLRVKRHKAQRREERPGEWVGKPDCGDTVRKKIKENGENGRDGLVEMRRRGIVD